MAQLPPLLFADTGTNPDQLYFSGVEVHDPFIAFGQGNRRITVQSALEFGRIKKARTFDEVLPLEKAGQGLKLIENREVFGKVVICP